ncbi:MAG: bifunctional phosphoribosylaminoimidazolecarboxamide formyltransferase/IMP cyclohydrolase [Bacteroidales bacterium]|nr:bifunctional phosphoribosylaminoimidazolecarboxamide formyltransferase/IMP cyclohydrolase [Bacteroidales bacterium]
MALKKISNCLISVFYKTDLDKIVELLKKNNVQIYATGGTLDFIKKIDDSVRSVESLTGYPSILGGRVKTLHPKVFGGILARLDNETDLQEMQKYEIPAFDLVIVDLYPFEETVRNTDDRTQIIEKIDIGGISLIRAGAKNFNDCLIVPSSAHYQEFMEIYERQDGCTSIEDRMRFAKYAFQTSSHYDTAIFNWFDGKKVDNQTFPLRYGENPHQQAVFNGNLNDVFEKLHGKDLSYNNLLDLDAGLNLIREFDEPTFAILKHNNPCGIASRNNILDAYNAALAGDPVSAFGGVMVSNQPIDIQTATEMNKMFFEVCVAPDYEEGVLDILFTKKNRIVLKLKSNKFPSKIYKSALNGILEQDRDLHVETAADFKPVTEKLVENQNDIDDLIFANKIVKHSRSNAIVLAKNKQLCASGIGQTSRVDSLRQAIAKAKSFNFDLNGAVLASDAFFPFDDCVTIANEAGIKSIVQPGGSVRDQDSIDACNKFGIAMVFTGYRHFKH